MDMLPYGVGVMIFHLVYFSPIVQICDMIHPLACPHQLGVYCELTSYQLQLVEHYTIIAEIMFRIPVLRL